MNNANKEKLLIDFPELFRDDEQGFNYHQQWGVQCGDGWFRLIYDLCAAITEHCHIAGIEIPEVRQIKEKFGTLRFYITRADPVISSLVEQAEQRSAGICEHCGLAGTLRQDGGWHRVLCDRCEQKYQSDRPGYQEDRE